MWRVGPESAQGLWFKINLSGVFAGQNVGVCEVADHIWLITFMHYDLGFFDDETSRVECAPNPFGAKLTYVIGKNRIPIARLGP